MQVARPCRIYAERYSQSAGRGPGRSTAHRVQRESRMPEGQGPATTRRRLRFELRRLREEKNLRLDEVVDKLDWSLSKLIWIENGSVGVSVTDVRALLGVYGAPPAIADDLVALARTARQ